MGGEPVFPGGRCVRGTTKAARVKGKPGRPEENKNEITIRPEIIGPERIIAIMRALSTAPSANTRHLARPNRPFPIMGDCRDPERLPKATTPADRVPGLTTVATLSLQVALTRVYSAALA